MADIYIGPNLYLLCGVYKEYPVNSSVIFFRIWSSCTTFVCMAILVSRPTRLNGKFLGYFSAILYSGFLKTPRGQIEAAKSIGLRKWIIFRKIILPQTLRSMYPSLCSQFIFVFLTTGVISEIGVVDLTHSGLYIDSRTFRSFEVFIVLTILYVLIALIFRSVLHMIFSKKLNSGI